jgi:hypothetical protein
VISRAIEEHVISSTSLHVDKEQKQIAEQYEAINA